MKAIFIVTADLPPPKCSLVASDKSGIRKILAEISVHKPTATNSERVTPSPKGLISKQATSTSKVALL